MLNKIPIIGVMGSGTAHHKEKAEPLGRWIAESGFHLLCGGGGGVMASVSKAFSETKDRKGLSIGIIPGKVTGNNYSPMENYPNPWIELPIYTHLYLTGQSGSNALSRNHINILSAHIVIALPGSYGTASEIHLALKYNKPVIGFFEDKDFVIGLNIDIPFYPDFEMLKATALQILNR